MQKNAEAQRLQIRFDTSFMLIPCVPLLTFTSHPTKLLLVLAVML
jgi:hypothetical protein